MADQIMVTDMEQVKTPEGVGNLVGRLVSADGTWMPIVRLISRETQRDGILVGVAFQIDQVHRHWLCHCPTCQGVML